MSHVTHIRSRVLGGCLALLCCLALSGCFEKTVLRAPVQTPPQRQTSVTPPVRSMGVADAEAAYNAGEISRAEQIATLLFSRKDLSPEEKGRVARIRALSAYANKHTYAALSGLEVWLNNDASAESSAEWRTAYLNTLAQFPERDGTARAQAMMANSGSAFPLRAGAALFLASRQWEKAGEAPQALLNLRTFYGQSGGKNQRAYMEHSLFAHLRDESELSLANLDALVDEENVTAYPHAVIRLETLRRKALHAATRMEAQEGAAVLAAGTTLADPSILRSWDPIADATTLTVPLPGRTIVLALPLSGGLGGIGKKIARGAEEARKEFAAAGYTVNVVRLDTQNPDWVNTLAAMPPQATIVGGPLRTDRFAAAHAAGLTSSRAFFAFMPSLGSGMEEGRVGWRFFSSREDQLAALFAATNRLGITEYAVLMPDGDQYAALMADMFTAHAQRAGARVVKRAEYPHANQEEWNKFIGSFLGAARKATHAPGVAHKAIFLPDSWRNMEILVPNLFYFMETRQLLLGTSLWEQGLSDSEHVTAHYYNLAVFPGAWDKTATLSQAGARLQSAYALAGLGEPDFWAGLGYDFVRFASTLDIQPGWSSSSVNALLSHDTGIPWSMAPLRWSAQGKARQELFLFTPVSGGFAPADMADIEARFNKAWKR